MAKPKAVREVVVDSLPSMSEEDTGIEVLDGPEDDEDIELGGPDDIVDIDEDDVGEPDEMTTTANFHRPTVVDAVEELPMRVVETPTKKRVVRVVEDVGPVFYGEQLVELKAGRRYNVPPHIYHYLATRNLIWGGK